MQALSSAVPSLVRALRDDDDHVRENAARARAALLAGIVADALGGFDSDAESHLLAALDDPSERVRCEIVVALGRLQAPESVPLLIDLPGRPNRTHLPKEDFHIELDEAC